MEKQNDLDWVRILAVLLLIPFHTSRIFDIFEDFSATGYAVVFSGVRFARFSLPDVLLFFINSFNIWFLLLAVLGFGQKYLSSDSKVLPYIREAAYPFYLIHQTVIVAIGFYVVQWKAGALPKFIVICLVSLVLTVLLYDLVVRRVDVIRFLFGMKPKIRRIKKLVFL